MKKSTVAWLMVGLILMFLLGCGAFFISSNKEDVFLWLSAGFLMAFSALCLVGMVVALVLNKPAITLYAFGIEFFSIFKRTQKVGVFWRDVEDIRLEYMAHKSFKYWILVIKPKPECGKVIKNRSIS